MLVVFCRSTQLNTNIDDLIPNFHYEYKHDLILEKLEKTGIKHLN